MNSTRKVWLIRAGRHGEDEEAALASQRVIIGWQGLESVANLHTVQDVANAIRAKDSSGNEHRIANFARQFWAFIHLAQVNDIVVLPLKTRPGQVAIGTIEGPYEYVDIGGQKRHTRRVKWVRPDVPRSTFSQDLLYSFGAFMTVCRIQRHQAEERVAAVLAGKPDPGFKEDKVTPGSPKAPGEDEVGEAASIDLEQAAQDDVVAFIRQTFPGHELARLIGKILAAEGYYTLVSPPGPDGGADILAGRGPFGLDSPTLCVQVKATEAPADVKILRELIGTMNTFKADQGLLVCWGGFTQPLKNEARQQTFKVRLWDQSDIVSAIYRAYEKLDSEIQAELPLKRVWMRVREQTEEAPD